MSQQRERRRPRNLAAIGLVFLLLGLVQAAVTDGDAPAYAMATGGGFVLVASALLWARNRG